MPRATLCLLVLGVAACDGARAAPVPVEDVRGAPFRETAPAEPAAAPSQAAPTPPLPPPPSAPAVPSCGPAQVVTLQYLADFLYDPPRLKTDADGKPIPVKVDVDPVPKAIRELTGKRLSIEGYIVPFDYADGTCSKFALSIARQYCCFGCTNRVNSYVEVTMAAGTRADCDTSLTVRVEGVFAVHRIEEEISALYTMAGETSVPLE